LKEEKMGWFIAIVIIGIIVVVIVMSKKADNKTMSMSDAEFDDQMSLTDAEFLNKWHHEKPQEKFRNHDSFILKKRNGNLD